MIGSTVSGSVAGSTNKTLLSVLSSADRRPRIKCIRISCSDATPTDAMISFALRRITADGTGTAVTPIPKDISDGTAMTCTAKKNYTVEPTYAAGNVAEFTLHVRASGEFRPGPGEEWAVPIGAGAGLGMTIVTNDTKNYRVEIIWDE